MGQKVSELDSTTPLATDEVLVRRGTGNYRALLSGIVDLVPDPPTPKVPRSLTGNFTVTENGDYYDMSVNEVYFGGADPTRHGFLDWTIPFYAATASRTLVNGTLYVFKMWAKANISISSLWINVLTAQTTGTSGRNWMGIYNAAGTLQQSSADQTTAWSTTGNKQATITPVAFNKGDGYYIAILQAASTPMAIAGAGASTGANINLSGSSVIYGVAATGQTGALPSTITPASVTASGAFVLPVGVS